MIRLALFLGLFFASAALSLPLYTAREGRTCDNCHTLPNTWKNPELKDRKCSLSCSVCHIDPTGGGLRNTSGRFFGQSTLPMLKATYRGYKDKERFLFETFSTWERPEEYDAFQSAKSELSSARATRKEKQSFVAPAEKLAQEEAAQLPALQAALTQATEARLAAQQSGDPAAISAAEDAYTEAEAKLASATQASNEKAQAALDAKKAAEEATRAEQEAQKRYDQAYNDLQKARAWVFTPAFGSPKGAPSANNPQQGRYGAMNADPLVSLGLDLRVASWSVTDTTLVFPMQFDTQVAVQPAQHLTAYVNAGVLAKEKGVAATLEREHPYALKDAMLLYSELPYNAYAKVGRFLPPFGTRLDDHTSFVRRDFELDYGIQESRVFGAEVGLAPNYPYANLAIFRPGEKDQFSEDDPSATKSADFFGVDGFGAAVSAGYRELGWQVGGSAMLRRRDIETGGDTTSLSVQWGVNPWFYSEKLPLTYLGELSVGRFQRASENNAVQAAAFHELNYSIVNGVTLRAKYDWSDPDFAVVNNHAHRVGIGADLTVLPGLRLSLNARSTFIPGNNEPTGSDLLIFLRAWL